MKIGRTVNWYRPYSVIVNKREYKLEKIHFYQENSILVSSQSGWLEDRNHVDLESIDLPVEEIKLRRKEKFDGEIFAIVHKEQYGHDTVADLYIPSNVFNVHFVQNVLRNHSTIYAAFEGDHGIYIERYVKSIDRKLYEIRNEYEEVHKKVNDSYLAIHRSEEVLTNLDRLKELAEAYAEERKRLRNLTIDDIEMDD